MYQSFINGKKWLDTEGKPIQAHGFSVFYDEKEKTYYWYGENKEKTDGKGTIWHWGVRCYSSKDLYNWDDRGLIIPPTPDDLDSPLHPTYCMDRPHIIYCEKTKKYVCWLKIMCDSRSQFMAVMQADDFMGPYEYVHKILKPLKMDTGDFALYKEENGDAYFIFDRPHFELVTAKLTEDYTNVTGEYVANYRESKPPFSREAPAVFKKGDTYYCYTSGTSSYYPNPTRVCRFKQFLSEYEDLGEVCIDDKDRTSFFSQFTCVLKVPDSDLYIAMADRWKPTKFDMWFGKQYLKMVDKAMSGGRHDDLVKPDYSPKEMSELPHKTFKHGGNTSISEYVWLPIEWKNDVPYIRWHEQWRLEDYIGKAEE